MLISSHSVLGAILTLKISRVMETLVFGSGWVVGITHFVNFCPIPRPLLSRFHSIENFTILPLFIKCKSVFLKNHYKVAAELDKTGYRE